MRVMLEPPATKSRTGSIELSLKDYGPISRGRVAFKPLTILVGPSGCGKTHVATLLHSALKAEERRIDWDLKDMHGLRGMKNWHSKKSPSSVLQNEAKKIYGLSQNNERVDSDICKHVAEFWSRSFESELERNTSGLFKKIKIGSAGFELEIVTEINRGKFVYGADGGQDLQVADLDRTNLSIEFKKYRDNIEMHSDNRLYRDKNTIHVKVPTICEEFDVRNALKFGVNSRAESSLNRSIYFPAERSGLTLLINMLLAGGIRRGKRGKRPFANVPGPVADLLSWFLGIKDTTGAFAPMAESFENDALNGKVILKTLFRPQIYYHVAEKSFSIREAASSVKDVALFLLYLKHAARCGDVVILEEPEINLHPSSQLLLARLVARLVCAGLHLVVSTHSPYFLEQLSHCVLGGTIQNEKREKVLPTEECPKVEDVALYQFKPHDGGYEICDMDITEEGIPQDEFTSVDNNLYGELTSLRQAEE